MIIANPIYDAVFKYLLEDKDIARDLLSAILGEQITSIEVKPQEQTGTVADNLIILYRVDFKAIIKTKTNETKKILIELQKAKHPLDVSRFRRYLGDNYRKPDVTEYKAGKPVSRTLPIVTVYFLGFKLPHMHDAPIVKVSNTYTNAGTGVPLGKTTPFLEQLTHTGFAVQIPLLKPKLKSRLEQLLLVFSQDFVTDDRHRLEIKSVSDDPLMNRIINRLHRGILSEELQEQMNFEDEYEEELLNRTRKIESLQQAFDKATKATYEANKATEVALGQVEEERKAKETALDEIKRLLDLLDKK